MSEESWVTSQPVLRFRDLLLLADVTVYAQVSALSPLGSDDELQAEVSAFLRQRGAELARECQMRWPQIEFGSG